MMEDGAMEAFGGFDIKHPDCVFIDGTWQRPVQGGTIEVVSPNTEEVVARVAEARETEMATAVAAARQAFDAGPWPFLTHRERGATLQAMADHLRRRKDELAHAWTQQSGALFAIAPGMVASAIGVFEYYAKLAGEFAFVEPRKTATGTGAGYLAREPVGVVAAIAPWNAPFSIMAYKTAPALLAGCCVIMKPAPETPVEAYIIAEAAEAAGVPAGVLNLVPAHREAADFLVRQPGVDKVSFTGSTLAGKRIASVCGERIARCTLELGGKSAAIVLEDYAVEEAVDRLSGAITLMTGQVCAALTRIVVPRSRHDQFADAFAERLGRIQVGGSYDPKTQMGPLAMGRQLDRVEGYIAKGTAEGAKLVVGGSRPATPNRGYFFEPTLFANVDNKMTIAQEEIFGPVLSLIPSDDVDDAIRIANDSNYGLNGAVFTNDTEAAYRIARRVRTGTIAQNGFRADFSIAFGGFKQSGIGREGGVEGLMPYLETKTVLLDGPTEAVA
jgi:aldehyde dehydrogenase (NAD+)